MPGAIRRRGHGREAPGQSLTCRDPPGDEHGATHKAHVYIGLSGRSPKCFPDSLIQARKTSFRASCSSEQIPLTVTGWDGPGRAVVSGSTS
jgi:hypothetical protein